MSAAQEPALPDQDDAAVPDGAELIPVGAAAKILGCSPTAVKKLAQARQPKVRGLAPGQGRNRSHRWVFVRGDIEQRAALIGRPLVHQDLRTEKDNLTAAYELADLGRRQEREDRLNMVIAERDRRIADLEAERDRLWDALGALRPSRRESAT